jgi:hypothetical protein
LQESPIVESQAKSQGLVQLIPPNQRFCDNLRCAVEAPYQRRTRRGTGVGVSEYILAPFVPPALARAERAQRAVPTPSAKRSTWDSGFKPSFSRPFATVPLLLEAELLAMPGGAARMETTANPWVCCGPTAAQPANLMAIWPATIATSTIASKTALAVLLF